ncbi:FAD-dependent monooxygenase [Streptomyces sp. NPDC002851]
MKAIICGAGIAGLALAARLRHHGWDVLVVDRASGPRRQGYMIDFFGPGYEALDAMGLLPRLRELGHRTSEFCYVDERGHRLATVGYDKFTRAAGGGLVSIMRPDLERLLREAVRADARPGGAGRVELRYGTTVERAEGRSVTLSDGERLDADLLVGADGIHARIRSLLFGPERDHLRLLGMHTAAYVFRDPELFQQVRGRFALTDTTYRQLGLYGLDDNRVAAFTVHRTGVGPGAEELPRDSREALREVFGGMGPFVERTLAHCPPGEEMYYDQVAQVEVGSWSTATPSGADGTGHTVLIGDAAHAVSLIAGQGASLGVAGAYVLAERLAAAGSVGTALAEYEERWRPVAAAVQAQARNRVGEWFLPTSTTRLRIRRWGFRALNLPGFDRALGGALFPKSRTTVAHLSA